MCFVLLHQYFSKCVCVVQYGCFLYFLDLLLLLLSLSSSSSSWFHWLLYVGYHTLLGAFAKFRKETVWFLMSLSVRPSARNNSTPIGWICVKFDIWAFKKNCWEKSCFIKIWQESGVLYIFEYLFAHFLLEWEMFSAKCCRGIKTHILHTMISPPPPENHDVYDIMWKNVIEPDWPQIAIRRMRSSCWITKATNTLSEYGTYWVSTATMLARTHLDVALYV
jgi:hypothetical protein